MKETCYTEKHKEKKKSLRLQKKKLITTLFFPIAFLTAIQFNAQTAKVMKGNVSGINGNFAIQAPSTITGKMFFLLTIKTKCIYEHEFSKKK